VVFVVTLTGSLVLSSSAFSGQLRGEVIEQPTGVALENATRGAPGPRALSPLRASIEHAARHHAVDLAVTDMTARPPWTLAAPEAQAPASDAWDSVLRLEQGTGVRVVSRQGRSVTGKVVAVTESGLSTDRGAFLRDEIARVSRTRGSQALSVWAYAGLGTLAGSVAGYIAGSSSGDCHGCGEQRLAAVSGGIGGAFFGGMGGYILGEVVHHLPEKVVYLRNSAAPDQPELERLVPTE